MRLTAEEERGARDLRRRAWEAMQAEAWLLAKMPDDPELRAYVHAFGMLLVANRALEKHTRSTARLATELLDLRGRYVAANAERRRWKVLTRAAGRDFDDARGRWRRERFRREHADELDHAAHVWAWYREKWGKT